MNTSSARSIGREICGLQPGCFSAKGALQPKPRPSAWVFAKVVIQALKGRTRMLQTIRDYKAS
jgi:hypothetical protein